MEPCCARRSGVGIIIGGLICLMILLYSADGAEERAQSKDESDTLAAEAARPREDAVKFAGLSPQEAVKAITLPPGFSATVFAAEPEVVQPIAFTIDHRGRLWVVEGLTYPQRAPEGQGKD